MNAAQQYNVETIQAIFDYLINTATQEERCRMRFHTKPEDCSPLIQVINANTFKDLTDLHPHATWVMDENLRHTFGMPRFVAAYNLITGEQTDESTV